MYKTTAKDDFPTTIRLGRHACKQNTFVEESESEIPDHSHPCLAETHDDTVFQATEYSIHHPPPPLPVHENLTTENRDALFTSKR